MKVFKVQVAWVMAGVLLLTAESALAGTWMRSEGESYYSARLEYETADEQWNQDWKREPLSCTARNWKLGQAYEYGLSYYRTVFGSLDYHDRDCGVHEVSSIGDLELGVRSRLDVFRNGRTWEVAAIIPTGYSTSGTSSVGSDLYGLRLGAFGRFGGTASVSGEATSAWEVGGNLHLWEGSASEMLSAYIKLSTPVAARSRVYSALEGDYALIDRSEDLTTTVNPLRNYGYDKLNARLGYTTKVTRDWYLAVEGSSVLWGRNVSDANSLSLIISRNFKE